MTADTGYYCTWGSMVVRYEGRYRILLYLGQYGGPEVICPWLLTKPGSCIAKRTYSTYFRPPQWAASTTSTAFSYNYTVDVCCTVDSDALFITDKAAVSNKKTEDREELTLCK